jgi:hypothetical protein
MQSPVQNHSRQEKIVRTVRPQASCGVRSNVAAESGLVVRTLIVSGVEVCMFRARKQGVARVGRCVFTDGSQRSSTIGTVVARAGTALAVKSIYSPPGLQE